MIIALLSALAAAAVFGIGAVLQGLANEGEPAEDRLDPWLLLRLARKPVFAGALLCNLAGLVLHVRALQDLPLFLVQAVIASTLIFSLAIEAGVERRWPTAAQVAKQARDGFAALLAGEVFGKVVLTR